MKKQAGEYRPFTKKWLVDLYFRYGSVNEARKKEKNLPFSDASFHRALVDYGVVKNIGRRKLSLGEALYFFAELAHSESFSLEGTYKSMPLFFKENTSKATLHRIYNRAVRKVERVKATALILTTAKYPNHILTAKETSGSRTIPIGHSLKDESRYNSILRVLQHEFSVKKVLSGELSHGGALAEEMIKGSDNPFCTFRILDLGVDVYHIKIPQRIKTSVMNSYKISDFKYLSSNAIVNSPPGFYRVGVQEIVESYRDYQMGHEISKLRVSSLNKALLGL